MMGDLGPERLRVVELEQHRVRTVPDRPLDRLREPCPREPFPAKVAAVLVPFEREQTPTTNRWGTSRIRAGA